MISYWCPSKSALYQIEIHLFWLSYNRVKLLPFIEVSFDIHQIDFPAQNKQDVKVYAFLKLVNISEITLIIDPQWQWKCSVPSRESPWP